MFCFAFKVFSDSQFITFQAFQSQTYIAKLLFHILTIKWSWMFETLQCIAYPERQTHIHTYKHHWPLQRDRKRQKKKQKTTCRLVFQWKKKEQLQHIIACLNSGCFCMPYADHFSFLCFPRLSSFLIRVFVSFVSISKCPAHQGLWDTIHTVISPTTTTGWEGTRAPTAGSR